MSPPPAAWPVWVLSLAALLVAAHGVRAQPPALPDPLPATAGGPRFVPGVPLAPIELEAYLDGLVEPTLERLRIAGAVVAIVQNGAPLLVKGYGYADVERAVRVDPRTTLFRIGSISKTFTWIALMRLVENGRLALDDPINMHLPARLQMPDQGFTQPIRVRDLMTHSPGLEDTALGHLFVRDPARLRTLTDYLAAERPDRVREPGLVSSYSNYGVGLAGAIIEQLEGRPWQDVLDTEILQPLGLDHTSGREPYPPRADLPAPMPAALAERLSLGYRWTGTRHEPRPFEHITHGAPAGAMSSSGADMARYMLMLLGDGVLDGERVFGAQAAQTFRTPMTRLPPAVGNWAGGFVESPLPGDYLGYGHDGATLDFFSSMTVVPALDLGVFVSTNTQGGGELTGSLTSRIVERFYVARPAAPPRGSPELTAAAQRYSGVYMHTRRSYSGLEGFLMRFTAHTNVTVTDDGFLTAELGRSLRFVPADTPGAFRSVDTPIGLAFEPVDGTATRFSLIGVAFERAGLLDRLVPFAAVALSSALVAMTILVAVIVRRGHRTPISPTLRRASHVRAVASLLWLLALVTVAVLGMAALESADVVIYTWPTPSILVFSTSALAASMLSLASIAWLPTVWRATGWRIGRKLAFTLSIVVFVSLAVILGHWGALQPWKP